VAYETHRVVRAYFGHHKCASRWVGQIVAQVALEAGLRAAEVVDDLTPYATGPLRSDHEVRFDRRELRERVDRCGVDIVSCITADRQQAEVLSPDRAFHVIRDPRDIIVSAYFSHRNSHRIDGLPHIAAHRAALREVSAEEGLLLEMEFSRNELLELGDWNYADGRILEVKMEDLTARPYDTFVSIFQHLELLCPYEPIMEQRRPAVWMGRLANRLALRRGLGRLRRRVPVTGEMLLGTVYARRFEAQTRGRAQGIEDVTSHYRKGVSGDWANYLAYAHAETFVDRFGDLLIKLGYEEDHGWVDRAGARPRPRVRPDRVRGG
jgi:hypothetical protein